MTSVDLGSGFCNRIISSLAVSIIAEKHNLHVNYRSYDWINELGILLFVGENKYKNTIDLTDDNYPDIYEKHFIESNLNPNNHYLQTYYISQLIYNYLHRDKVKINIIDKNHFKYRYNKNNDLYIHIRLTDAAHLNPGSKYYLKCIEQIHYDNIYLSTDDLTHTIIKEIINNYPKILLIEYNEVKTIQFASTCKNVVLSHGTFSAIIGYLSFYSNIYYPEFKPDRLWHGDIFSIDGWNKISY